MKYSLEVDESTGAATGFTKLWEVGTRRLHLLGVTDPLGFQ